MDSAETSAQTVSTGPVSYSVKYLTKIEKELKEVLEKREELERNLVILKSFAVLQFCGSDGGSSDGMAVREN